MLNTHRRLLALCGYVACLAAGPAVAQVGPIQPVLVMVGSLPETAHNRTDLADDYSIPLDVYVGADGLVSNAVVSDSSGNVQADGIATAYIRERPSCPASTPRAIPSPARSR